MKINKKGIIGVLAGLGLTAIGGYCLLKKNNDNYVETEIELDDDTYVTENVESDED